MHSPTRLLALATLVLGCATGNGTAEGLTDEDVGPTTQADSSVTTFGDASLFPFLDHPSDAPVSYRTPTDVPAAGRDAQPVDPGLTCAAPREACGGGCVDTSINPAHCGGCNRPCGVGETCSGGACQSACAAPRTMCSGSCVDPSSDIANCGACGRRCTTGQTCAAGVCSSTCAAPRAMCGAACVDRSTDLNNCGACGVRCTTGQSCVAGVCRSPTPTTAVGQACSRGNLCSGGLLCRTDWPSGYCTDYCASDSDCDPGSVCISDGYDDFCGRSCTATSQCRAGYGCYRISATQGACAPL